MESRLLRNWISYTGQKITLSLSVRKYELLVTVEGSTDPAWLSLTNERATAS